MKNERAARSGGRILVDSLRIHGADRAFCVPGESYLDVLNAFHDTPELNVVVCKHEGAAANMAEADGRLTGRPGICFVTRGPGATHASIGVHAAMENSTPMVLFIGQVDRAFFDREAFQEIDYRQMFRPLAKWAAQIEDPEPDSRIRAPRVSDGHLGTTGSRGAGIAGRHAGAGRAGRRHQALPDCS